MSADCVGVCWSELQAAGASSWHIETGDCRKAGQHSQQEAEAECDHMDLLALIVLSNSAHSASRPAIASLQERYTRAAFTCAVAPCSRNVVSCPGQS